MKNRFRKEARKYADLGALLILVSFIVARLLPENYKMLSAFPFCIGAILIKLMLKNLFLSADYEACRKEYQDVCWDEDAFLGFVERTGWKRNMDLRELTPLDSALPKSGVEKNKTEEESDDDQN